MSKIFNYVSEGNIRTGKLIGHIVLGIVLVILFFGSWGIVRAGQRGILLQLGAVQDKIFDEGLYFKIPLIQGVKKMDVRFRKTR